MTRTLPYCAQHKRETVSYLLCSSIALPLLESTPLALLGD